MPDHLEQAAAKAVELAEELSRRGPDLDVRAALHFHYLAGLIRGGAVPTIPAREILRGRLSASVTRAGVLRDAAGQRVWPPVEDPDLGDHDPLDLRLRYEHMIRELAKTRHAAKVAEEQCDRAQEKLERQAENLRKVKDQRDDLLQAARDYLAEDNGMNHNALREVVERIESGG